METILLIAVIAIYFVPSFAAARKRNFPAIVILNIFLGWTFIGWVIALVWAMTKE